MSLPSGSPGGSGGAFPVFSTLLAAFVKSPPPHEENELSALLQRLREDSSAFQDKKNKWKEQVLSLEKKLHKLFQMDFKYQQLVEMYREDVRACQTAYSIMQKEVDKETLFQLEISKTPSKSKSAGRSPVSKASIPTLPIQPLEKARSSSDTPAITIFRIYLPNGQSSGAIYKPEMTVEEVVEKMKKAFPSLDHSQFEPQDSLGNPLAYEMRIGEIEGITETLAITFGTTMAEALETSLDYSNESSAPPSPVVPHAETGHHRSSSLSNQIGQLERKIRGGRKISSSKRRSSISSRRVLTNDEMSKCREVSAELSNTRYGIPLKSHKHRLRSYDDCFSCSELFAWLVDSGHAVSLSQAVELGHLLVDSGTLFHVAGSHTLKEDSSGLYTYYKQSNSRADRKLLKVNAQFNSSFNEARKEYQVNESKSETKVFKRAVKSLWEAYDLDGNGVLDLDEQEAFFESVYEHLFGDDLAATETSRSEMISEWRLKFDSNHDDELSWDEFKTSMSWLMESTRDLVPHRASTPRALRMSSSLPTTLERSGEIPLKVRIQRGSIFGNDLVATLQSVHPDIVESLSSAQLGALRLLAANRYVESTSEAPSSPDSPRKAEETKSKRNSLDLINPAKSLRPLSKSSHKHTRSVKTKREIVVPVSDEIIHEDEEVPAIQLLFKTHHDQLEAVRKVIVRSFLQTHVRLPTNEPFPEKLEEGVKAKGGREKKLSRKALDSCVAALAETRDKICSTMLERLESAPLADCEVPDTTIAKCWDRMRELLHARVPQIIPIDERRLRSSTDKKELVLMLVRKLDSEDAAMISIGSSLLSLLYDRSADQLLPNRMSLVSIFNTYLNHLHASANTVATIFHADSIKVPSHRSRPKIDPVELWKEARVEVLSHSSSDEDDAFLEPATLPQLLYRLTSSTLTLPHLTTVLSAVRNTKDSNSFCHMLMAFYQIPSDVFLTDPEKYSLFLSRILKVLRFWILDIQHELSPSTKNDLRDFLSDPSVTKKYGDSAQSLLRILQKKREVFPFPTFECTVYTLGGYTPQNMFSQYEMEYFCDQISLVDFKMYKSLTVSEFEKQNWTKEATNIYAPNLVRIMNHVNDLAHLCAMAVILPERLADRQESFKRLLNLVKLLLECENYTSLSGILTGLNMAAVSRLKFTTNLTSKWNGLRKNLEQYQDPSNSFGHLRSAMGSAKDCIPFLGIALGDLVQISEGNPDEVDVQGTSMVNLSKFHMMNKTITDVLQYKSPKAKSYYSSLTRMEPLYSFIAHPCVMAEEELYQLSLEREPRGVKKEQIV